MHTVVNECERAQRRSHAVSQMCMCVTPRDDGKRTGAPGVIYAREPPTAVIEQNEKTSRLFSREENDIHYSAVSSLTGSMDLIRRDSKSANTKANTAKPAAIMTTPDMAQTVTSISVAMLLKVVIEPSMIS